MLAETTQVLQVESRTEEQQFFLDGLDRLVDLDEAGTTDFDASYLLHRAIYSTYADCRSLGMDGPARVILSQLRSATTASPEGRSKAGVGFGARGGSP